MKNTVKVIVVFVIGILSTNSFGQFGVKAGLGVSSLKLKDRDDNVGKEFFNAGFAFQAGFGYEIAFGDKVSVEPALLYSHKSVSADLDAEFFKVKTHLVEIPINVKVYVLELGNGINLYALGGGYVSYLFSVKSNGNKLDIGNKSTDNWKPLDGGISVGAGARLFDSLNVDISGGIGIANLSNDQTNGQVRKLNVVKLGVTYQFGGSSY